jgi:purine-binding chemotaxis protein CheW
MRAATKQKASRTGEYVVFRVADVVCGLEIDVVQEINRNLDITRVYSAPSYVLGIINLRGQIVTVISLRRKLGLPMAQMDGQTRNVVVKTAGEHIGLVVDVVEDIVNIERSEIVEPPPHMSGGMGDYFAGVYQSRQELVALLDVDALLDFRG